MFVELIECVSLYNWRLSTSSPIGRPFVHCSNKIRFYLKIITLKVGRSIIFYYIVAGKP